MSQSAEDVVGLELGKGLELLAKRGERVGAVVELGCRPVVAGDERTMIIRQRRLEDGSIELTVCPPRPVETCADGEG